jgi:hypothetical protein
VGVIRPRILLSAALDGRATFLVAGAALGIGVYGFAVTFKPYESGRVLQPFPVLEPVASIVHGPLYEPPSAVLPEPVAAAEAAPPPVAPGDVAVSIPRPTAAIAASIPSAPAVEAAGSGEVTPLDPIEAVPDPEPAQRELPPVVIAPENVLVYIHPGWSWLDDDEKSHLHRSGDVSEGESDRHAPSRVPSDPRSN